MVEHVAEPEALRGDGAVCLDGRPELLPVFSFEDARGEGLEEGEEGLEEVGFLDDVDHLPRHLAAPHLLRPPRAEILELVELLGLHFDEELLLVAAETRAVLLQDVPLGPFGGLEGEGGWRELELLAICPQTLDFLYQLVLFFAGYLESLQDLGQFLPAGRQVE